MNSLKTTVVSYLIQLHALEIGAGLNFRFARFDLRARDALPAEVEASLDSVIREEMDHGRNVRAMLRTLGYANNAHLMRVTKGLEQSFATYWRSDTEGWARIAFNHLLESRFADHGAERFIDNMRRAAPLIDAPRDFDREIDLFAATVPFQEAGHVALCERVLGIYQRLHPGIAIEDEMRAISIWQSPLMPVLRLLRGMNGLKKRLADASR